MLGLLWRRRIRLRFHDWCGGVNGPFFSWSYRSNDQRTTKFRRLVGVVCFLRGPFFYLTTFSFLVNTAKYRVVCVFHFNVFDVARAGPEDPVGGRKED